MDPFQEARHSSSAISLSEATEYDYVKWINKHLIKASPPLSISDITEANVRNGVALGLLLEIVGGVKLNGLLLQPGTRVERLHNVHELFAVLRRLNVRLGNLQPEDVLSGDKDTILQLTYAISSHFSRPVRGRRSVSPGHRMFDGRGLTENHILRSSPRHTPIDRFLPTTRWNPRPGSPADSHLHSEHYTEISNPVYSHQVIGPTVYTPPDPSGRASPRSRSSMTMMFSGQRSPTSLRRPGSRGSDVSSLPSDIRTPSKARPSANHSDRVPAGASTQNHIPAHGSVVTRPPTSVHPHHAHSQLHSELSTYIESMNELSSLKTQLGTISKLSSYPHRSSIASESSQLTPTLQAAVFPSKAVPAYLTPHQTDSYPSLSSEIHDAQNKIAELTRMLQAKEAALRQREQENMRLSETVHRLQEVLEHTGQEMNSRPVMNNHFGHHNAISSPDRYSGSITNYTHSYDPRHNPATYKRTSTIAPYPASRNSPLPCPPKTDSTHVKHTSMDLTRNQGPFYGEDIYVPVERY